MARQRKYLTKSEAARVMGCSAANITKLVKNGTLPPTKAGKVLATDVREYMESRNPLAVAKGDAERVRNGSTPEKDDIPLEGEPGSQSLAQAKTKEAIWKAERAELIYKRDSGLLLDREVVEGSLEAMATTIQMRIKNLAPKLRPHMSDAGREILDRELDGVLMEMASDVERMVPDVED
ncbi:helix-turn-helix domain-containing protein [Sulfitobacter sp. 1A15106]|uniref:helix-turn-helix domain-containing protein n=1 Tax=Sulfitobacter sp. 1A15106 TaxID=3368590 RepID=UPI0037455792